MMCNIGLPNHRYGGFSRRHSQSRSDDVKIDYLQYEGKSIWRKCPRKYLVMNTVNYSSPPSSAHSVTVLNQAATVMLIVVVASKVELPALV